MAAKWMKIKRGIIPLITATILLSQAVGCTWVDKEEAGDILEDGQQVQVTSEPTVEVTPEVTPKPIVESTVEVTPELASDPTPTPEPTPTPTPAPSTTPEQNTDSSSESGFTQEEIDAVTKQAVDTMTGGSHLTDEDVAALKERAESVGGSYDPETGGLELPDEFFH